MFSSVLSATVAGVDCIPIKIEADVSQGLPMFSMVGYLSARVKEAQERVRTALRNTGFAFPARRITVNLSPADIRKEGTGFDLPIAAALLCAFGYLEQEKIEKVCMAGELSLNGEVRGVKGILPLVDTAIKEGCRLCIIPKENLPETEYIHEIPILGIENLREFMDQEEKENWGAVRNPRREWPQSSIEYEEDFADVLGQETARQAAVIAAAGFHNLLLIGTKGSGKTMIANRIPTLFPVLSREESMEISRIYSAAGLLTGNSPMLMRRPFRAPHHTISPTAMAGGGSVPTPGEITLAHRGILFLDELPEFRRAALEVLRQPLETHKICISRVNGTYEFPANFLLVGAMNPCPCGYYPDRNRCSCTQYQVEQYLGKLSGPLLDRFDLCTEVTDIPGEQLREKKPGKTSLQLRREVCRVHEVQRQRYEGTDIRFNSALSGKETKQYCQVSREGKKLLDAAYEKMNLSLRAYHKILKTARTIADLDAKEIIEEEHIAEAVCYRALDKKYWR